VFGAGEFLVEKVGVGEGDRIEGAASGFARPAVLEGSLGTFDRGWRVGGSMLGVAGHLGVDHPRLT